MLKIRLEGRLGNQLFIYAFARKLVYKYHKKVVIYDRTDEKSPKWHSHLGNYKIDKNIFFTNNRYSFYRMNPIKFALLMLNRKKSNELSARKFHDFQISKMQFFKKNNLFLLKDGYYPLPARIKKSTYFQGFFQSPKYFDDIRPLLLKELIPVHNYTQDELDFIKKIESTESVCVTIRLGDYLNNSVHQVCTRKYYKDAMRIIKKRKPNCKFFIFSDDIDEAKKIFDFDFPVTYDSGKMKDYVSLYTMSKCKHFIISNSSFSWWAQYLSQNPNKIVIAPNRWYATDVPCDIYEDNWDLLKV